MTLKKLLVKNYKQIENICIPLNPSINLFVGENDAGKSTLLEAISILTTGKLNGYAFERQLRANMFNSGVRQKYIIDIDAGLKPELPEIVFEAYFECDAEYRGTNNTLGEDSEGINITVRIADNNTIIYKKLLKAGEIKDIPIELYTVDYNYFSGSPVNYRFGPFKSVFIDATKKEYSWFVDHFISDSVSQNLSDDQLRDIAIAYKKSIRGFHDDDNVRALSDAVKDVIQGRSVSLELREEEIEAWKRQLSIVVDEIPFEYLGYGTQKAIKMELALRNVKDQANIVMMEEPENNLSFSNMTRLVNFIASSTGKQIFISTHNSFIANKLDLSNVIFVSCGSCSSFRNLPDDTKKFFIKLASYDTLRFALASKTILVEGPTDELILQRAYKDIYGRLPHDSGIDIIVVGSLAFKHYCEIASLIGKETVIVTDNDGDVERNITGRYKGYIDRRELSFYFEDNPVYNTIEPSVLAVNCENGNPSENFTRIISSETRYSLKGRDYEGILEFMENNKTEWAIRVFENSNAIKYPDYIMNAVSHYEKHC